MGKGENSKLKCTGCGGDVVKTYRTVDEDEEAPIGRCLSCGKEYDQYTGEFYRYFADDFTQDVGNSMFKLGLKGILGGVEYEIIGRIRMQEEDEYEKSTWDEWLAVSSDGVQHYFVEEDGELNSYEEYVPESIDLESDTSSIIFEGKKINRDTAYSGRIVFFEGELTWKPEIGEAVTCYDFKKDGRNFTIEQTDDEVSVTMGVTVSYKDYIQAFGREDVRKSYENTMSKRRLYRTGSFIFTAGAMLSFILAIYSYASYETVKNVMVGKSVITSNEPVSENSQSSYFSQVVYGPFELSRKNGLYDVDIYIDEKVQRLNLSWQSFRFMLLKEDNFKKATDSQTGIAVLKNLFSEIDALKDPLESYTMAGDFWDEKGVDSEGTWHENDLRGSSSFVIDEPGKYYAYLELYSEKKREIDSVKYSLTAAGSVRYYLIAAVLMIVLIIVNITKARMYNELPFDVASK